jgi:hypothetical protein
MRSIVSSPVLDALLIGAGVQDTNAFGVLRMHATGQLDPLVVIHEKPIRDIQVHAQDSLVLSVALDGTLCLSALDMPSAHARTWQLKAPGWSCAWHPQDPHYVIAGLANGTILLYDQRHTTQPLCQLPSGTWMTEKPTHTLQWLSDPSSASGYLLMAANFDGVLAWDVHALTHLNEQGLARHSVYASAVSEACFAMSVDTHTRQCLLSHRRRAPPLTWHVVGNVYTDWTQQQLSLTILQTRRCTSIPSFQSNMTRPLLFSVGDEAACTLAVTSTTTGAQVSGV